MPVKVSVIVPVYNAEKCLDKCLNSLVMQTLDSIEVIAVNDGSTDGSQEIIDAFAEKHPDKVIALAQENKGTGMARNYGVSHAGGEFIGFVDQDDWVHADMYKRMYETASGSNSDVVICDFFRVTDDDKQIAAVKVFPCGSSFFDNLAEIMKVSISHYPYPWNKLFRSRLIKDTPFPGTRFEDVATIPVVLSNCGRISYISEPLNYYRIHGESQTSDSGIWADISVINAWKRCLADCSPDYIKEMEYAVYVSLVFFLANVKVNYDNYLAFLQNNVDRFKNNTFIQQGISSGKTEDLFKLLAPVKVSVIVPVYNVEKYLEKCLNSLIAQTLRDIEIIVVNDGSTDGSQGVIDAFAEKYPDKIIALAQENNGPGAARNFGVARARGDYIGFVDADDWAEPNMFERLYDAIREEDSDMAICDYYKVVEESGECDALNLWSEDKKKLGTVSGFVQLSTNPAMSWNKLYKRKLVQNTPYPPTSYYEDVATIPIITSNCGKITFLAEPLYYYLKRPGSITSQRHTAKNLAVMQAWDRCLEECNSAYIREMEYAIYVSIGYFLLARREHLDEFYIYFWKNEDRFKYNRYILKETLENELIDLFTVMDKAGAAGDLSSPLAQNLMEFVEDTTPLIEQLDNLPTETLAELRDMYGIAMRSANENVAQAGPKLLVQLCNRYERIEERFAHIRH